MKSFSIKFGVLNAGPVTNFMDKFIKARNIYRVKWG